MRKTIIFTIIIILTVALAAVRPVKADNGVVYQTYTYSRSQGGMVRTQDAYISMALITDIDGYPLQQPQDIAVDAADNLYIADSAAGYVLKIDLAHSAVTVIGAGFLQEPTGVAIDEAGRLYVADLGHKKGFRFSCDAVGAGYVLDAVYERPDDSPMFLPEEPFEPAKIVVDRGGNVYLVLAGNINGLAQYRADGEFYGFYGGNQIPSTLRNVIRFVLFNEQQRRNWFKMIPKPIYNVTVDRKGSILTTTKTLPGYKKLNIGNTVISEPVFGFPDNEDLTVGPINNIYAISEEGWIGEYTAAGDLLFLFGGKDLNQQMGLFTKPSGIAVDSRFNIYVTDGETGALQIFYPTAFADKVHQALDLYQNGQYAESEELWREVLKMNGLFDLAHRGLGNAYFVRGEYAQAMASYRLAYDKAGYSNAYWEVRNLNLLSGAQYFILGLFIVLVLYLINLKLRFGHYLLMPFSYLAAKLKKYRLGRELGYALTVLRHPIDGFYGIKKEGKTSILSATVLLFILYVAYVISLYGTGFLFANQPAARINLFAETSKVLVPFLLWVIANYLVASVRDGEGKFAVVYQASVYMLLPMLVALPVLIFISNFLTFNESFVYEFGYFIAGFVTVIYVIVMVKEIHNYNIRSSVANILISVFTALMLAVVTFIVYILVGEIIRFIGDILMEVRSRG